MATLVPDASVAAKWFLAGPDTQRAEAVLAGGAFLVAPEQLLAEAFHVFAVKVRAGMLERRAALEAARRLRLLVDEFVPTATLAEPALALALDLGHPLHDCLYLALARERGAAVVTADRQFLARVRRSRWRALVVGLDEF